MIFDKIIDFLFDSLIVIFSLFSVHLETLPVIGAELVSILTTMTQTWNTFMETFPYAQTTWDIFLIVIIPFEIMMLTLKFFVGHRLPAHV